MTLPKSVQKQIDQYKAGKDVTEQEVTEETVDVEYTSICCNREKALLFKLKKYKVKMWFPKSQIKVDNKKKIIKMPKWIAIDRGLI
jgi:hypothetical protein